MNDRWKGKERRREEECILHKFAEIVKKGRLKGQQEGRREDECILHKFAEIGRGDWMKGNGGKVGWGMGGGGTGETNNCNDIVIVTEAVLAKLHKVRPSETHMIISHMTL
jgi:hypothetical protein